MIPIDTGLSKATNGILSLAVDNPETLVIDLLFNPEPDVTDNFPVLSD